MQVFVRFDELWHFCFKVLFTDLLHFLCLIKLDCDFNFFLIHQLLLVFDLILPIFEFIDKIFELLLSLYKLRCSLL